MGLALVGCQAVKELNVVNLNPERQGGTVQMKRVLGALLVAGLMCVTVTPASAYTVTLDVWNTTQLQASGDTVTVDISGNTITFTFSSGGGLTNTFQAMQNIGFQPAVFGTGNTVTGASSPYTLSCGTATGSASSTGTCNEDGFAVNPALVEYSTPNGGPGNPLVATFTFANNVVAGLTSSDFDVHVTYSGSCSGWVDGTLSGSPGSDSSCTPVPEPMTMFLGGTGLLVMGYVARKRLFSMGRSVAV